MATKNVRLKDSAGNIIYPQTYLKNIVDYNEATQGTVKSVNNVEPDASGNVALTIPSKTSELTNDSGFITNAASDLTNYYNKTEVDAQEKAITDLIPTQASTTNQLADKEFVNSSISTATATFRGTFTSTGELPTTGVDLNDYAYIKVVDSTTGLVKQYDRYKYTGTAWEFEYTLNNSSFTEAQWTAINSGITANAVTTIGNLKTVATSGSYNDLSDKPSIPSKTSDLTDWSTATADFVKSSTLDSYATKTELQAKQDTLTSGTNIKTVNGESILGSGNLVIEAGISYEELYDITYALTQTTIASAPKLIGTGDSYTMTAVAATGYGLPETITVSGASYGWNSTTGVLTISNPTGAVTVTITSLVKLPTPTNVTADGTTISFDAVENATSYDVIADGTTNIGTYTPEA